MNNNDVPLLTLQGVYDKVARHLLTQRARSRLSVAPHCKDLGGGCAYRGEGGRACAVGCLIPDNAYDPGFDDGRWVGQQLGGKGASGTTLWMILEVPQFSAALRAGGVDVSSQEVLRLLAQLQHIHDALLVQDWAVHLRGLARDHGLSPAVVGQMEAGHATP